MDKNVCVGKRNKKRKGGRWDEGWEEIIECSLNECSLNVVFGFVVFVYVCIDL